MKLIIRMVFFLAAAFSLGMGIDFVMAGLGVSAYTLGAFGGAAAFTAAGLLTKPQRNNYGEELQNLKGANAQIMQEKFNKAVNDFNYLTKAQQETNSPSLKGVLIQLQNTSHKMISYLEKHPQQIAAADKFINYYQESAVSLVKQYIELEKSGLDSPHATETKRNTLKTLRGFQQAYQEQFDKMMNDHLMYMDAEVSVAQYAMKEDGIEIESEVIDDNPYKSKINLNKNTYNNQNSYQYSNSYEYTFNNDNDNKSTGIFSSIKNKMKNMAITALQNAIKRQFQPPENRPVDNSFKGRALAFLDDFSKWGIFYFDRNYPLQDVNKIAKYRYTIAASSIFLGNLGIPYFLMGKTFKGLLCLLFCWTPLPTIWGIYKGAQYIIMENNEFYYRYYLSKFDYTKTFTL